MKKKLDFSPKYIILLSFLIVPVLVNAQNPALVTSQSFLKNTSWSFKENKGQLQDENQNSINDIPFYARQGRVNIYCKEGTIVFVFTKEETGEKVAESGFSTKQDESISETNRAELQFLNANLNAKIVATDKLQYYENFYTTPDGQNGITNVCCYNTVTYKNIYPNIDLLLQCRGRGLEYSFIVHRGGNVADIQLQWNGLQNIKPLENGGIEYELPQGTERAFSQINSSEAIQTPAFTESAPYSYQSSISTYKSGEKTIIKSCFIQKGNNISVKTGRYDKTKDLVIDPTLLWGTYYGGKDDDGGNSITKDIRSNVYITGFTKSLSGIATSGAYQTSNAGVINAFITKFSPSGSILWATYYGGPKNAIGYGIITDKDSNVYITGTTVSKTGIATTGSYQTSLAGGSTFPDAFLAKFNSSGSIVWGTYYGGTQSESGLAITADTDNNIYIVGTTQSPSGIATAGAYQTRSGNTFVAKFSPAGGLLWGTYYGGGGSGSIQGIAADTHNNIYITGYTSSKQNITTTGAWQTSLTGITNSFVAKFSDSGSYIWGTYYGGDSIDKGQGIATDLNNNVYITGLTFSSKGLASHGAYQTSYGGGEDAFVAKFTPSGNLVWGTYYGKSGQDAAEGISTDADSNIYIIGTTFSEYGMATSAAYKTKGDSVSGDAFVAKFTAGGNLAWGTYYGGDSNDVGNAIVAGSNNNIYITGFTESKNGIATSGAYQTKYNSPNEDVFLADFSTNTNYDDAGVSSITSPTGSICPDQLPLTVRISNYGAAPLTSCVLSLKINSTIQNPYNWLGNIGAGKSDTATIELYNFTPGTDTIVAWTSSPNRAIDTIFKNDTSKAITIVNSLPIIHIGSSTKICANATDSIGGAAVSGYLYSWTSSPVGFTSTLSDPVVDPRTTTIYYLKETIKASGCTNSDSLIIQSPYDVPTATAGRSRTICAGDTIIIGSSIVSGTQYSWTSNPNGYASTNGNPLVAPTTTTTYTLTVTSPSDGCHSSDSVLIHVNPAPNPKWTVYISRLAAKFTPYDKSEKSYIWNFGQGLGFGDTSRNPQYNFNANGTYTVKLIVTTDSGCTAQYDSSIVVNTTGISNSEPSLSNFTIYPNPAISAINIESGINIIRSVIIIDATGKEVCQIANLKTQNQSISVNNLPAGIYLVKLEIENGNFYLAKFMKE